MIDNRKKREPARPDPDGMDVPDMDVSDMEQAMVEKHNRRLSGRERAIATESKGAGYLPDKPTAPSESSTNTVSSPAGLKKENSKVDSNENRLAGQEPVPARRNLNPAEDASAEDAFEKIRKIVGRSSPEIEARPEKVSVEISNAIETLGEKGAAWLRENPDRDKDDGYIVGIDFGTSSLKIVFRQPYIADEPVAAMEAPPPLRSLDHPYLWQTVVWFDQKDESFSLCPRAGSVPLDGFKLGIIAGWGDQQIGPELPTLAEVATAFLSLHFRNMIGRYLSDRPLGPAGGKGLLAINIGIPIAAKDDAEKRSGFENIVSAAYALARMQDPVDLGRVRGVHSDGPRTLPDSIELVPELTAALVGYANADTTQLGAHFLIDVGASTLDMVAFNLVPDEIKAFSASVKPLGAAALDIVRRAALEESTFLKACNGQFEKTYTEAEKEEIARVSFHPDERSSPVQLLVTGGGCGTLVHSALINRLPKDYLNGPEKRGIGERSIEKPSPPKKIVEKYDDCDRSRLLIAYGLAHDEPERLSTTLPSKIPLFVRAPRQNDVPYTSKDQV